MKSLTGTWSLVRLALRRDRIRIPVWIILICAFVLMSVASLPEVYSNAEERQARAQMMSAPTTKALAGPGHGFEDYTFGAMVAQELFAFAAVFVAIMSVLLTVRHTRAEEANGSAELVRSNVVGRHASSASTLIVVGATNVLLALAMTLGLGGLGIESITWVSSLLFGAGLAVVGIVFMGIALLTAQISEYSRAASGIAGAAIAAFYAIRGFGDMSDNAASWLSPFGWAQATKMYVDDRWWPLLIAMGFAAICIMTALILSTRRDVGAGMFKSRRGRATARPSLLSSNGLAFRLQRNSVMWWTIGLTLFGLMYGTLVGEIEKFIEEIGFADELLAATQGAALIDSFLAMIVSMLATITTIFAILSVLRLRGEENSGRVEPLLATAVSRARWAASHLLVALIGSAFILLAAVLGLGVTAAAVTGDGSLISPLIGAALVNVPAVWLTIGLAMALFGLSPKLATIVWIVPIYGFAVNILGGLLSVPEWSYDLSPFSHVPLLPAEDVVYAPLIVLLLTAGALTAVGLLQFRRRDITTT